jgi:hypothetical protein
LTSENAARVLYACIPLIAGVPSTDCLFDLREPVAIGLISCCAGVTLLFLAFSIVISSSGLRQFLKLRRFTFRLRTYLILPPSSNSGPSRA